MKPLILRPEPQASALAEQLRNVGHDPVVSPLLSIVAGDDLPLLATALSNHDRLIAISSHAVEQAATWLNQQGISWPAIPTFAVGAATAAASSWPSSCGRAAPWSTTARATVVTGFPLMVKPCARSGVQPESTVLSSAAVRFSGAFWSWFQPPKVPGFISYCLLSPATVLPHWWRRLDSLRPASPREPRMPPWWRHSARGIRHVRTRIGHPASHP